MPTPANTVKKHALASHEYFLRLFRSHLILGFTVANASSYRLGFMFRCFKFDLDGEELERLAAVQARI